MTMAAAYQLVYDMCEYRKDLRNTWSLKARARLLNTIFFPHIIHILYIHTISSLSRSISLPSCVEAIRNRTTDIIYLTCGQSIYTHVYIIYWPYWFMAPEGDRAPLPPPAAYAVYLSVVIIYRFRQTIGACAASRGCKNTKRWFGTYPPM